MDKKSSIDYSSVTAYKKPEEVESYVQGKRKSKSRKKTNQNSSQDVKGQESESPLQDASVASTPYESTPLTQQAAKRRQRFISLYSPEGKAKDVIQLPGRHPCECQASKHKLINNCIHCGRIVCAQEGSGPCFTCNNLVCTKEEKEILAQDTKRSQQLHQKLLALSVSQPSLEVTEDLQKAIEHKNRLLEYARNAERRTKVIDDDSDYYSVSNRWLTEEQRKMLQQKEEEIRDLKQSNKNKQLITLDFSSHQVLQERATINENELMKPVIEEIEKSEKKTRVLDNRPIVDPALHITGLQYISSGASFEKQYDLNYSMRVQDKDLQEMSDEGMCLSVHQPYASLIIAGVKVHEGRSWYTSYRGRLWIHAAGKPPLRQDINEIEACYRCIVNDDVKFPQSYPTGSLLGCVDLVECLPQEEYRQLYPNGESQSPYVFILENPKTTKMQFPMRGKHQIFKMDLKIHQAAKKSVLNS